VTEFLVETYISRSQPTGGPRASAELSEAAEQVTREGHPVRLVRSIVVPEEETCFYLFQAQTADAVREAATRAGLHFGRVLEAAPEWASPAGSTPSDSTADPHTPTTQANKGDMQ